MTRLAIVSWLAIGPLIGPMAGSMIGLVAACATAAEPVRMSPSYQRHRGGHGAIQRPSHRPGPYRSGHGALGRQQQQGSTVAAGTHQRPYPYHLDYYKREYGGTYEPYFGNLYGPPNVVLGAPFGGYGYPFTGPYAGVPQAAGPYAQGYQPNYPAPVQQPAPAVIVCPHCQQSIYLEAHGVTGTVEP